MAARRGGSSKRGAGSRGFRQDERMGKEVVEKNREGRVGVAHQTLAILDSGSFTSPTGIEVDISEELAQCCSQVQKSLQHHFKIIISQLAGDLLGS